MLFTDELARRFHGKGSFASANCIDPGPTATQIVRYAYPERALQRKDMTQMQLEKQARMFGLKTPAQAAQGVVWLSESNEVRQLPDGQWWNGPKILFPSVELSWRNEAMAKGLWETSEEFVKPFLWDHDANFRQLWGDWRFVPAMAMAIAFIDSQRK